MATAGMERDVSARGDAVKVQKERRGEVTGLPWGLRQGWKGGCNGGFRGAVMGIQGVKAGGAAGPLRKCKRYIECNTGTEGTTWGYKRGQSGNVM